MVSLDVEQVVMRALAKDPQQRFPGVQAFAEALARCSQSVPPKLFLPPVPVLQPSSTPQETEAVFLPRVLPATVAVSPHRAAPPKPGISRRTFMRIGAGLGLVAAGGIACLVANELGHMAAQRPTSISTPTTVPTPTPLVTTILTYKGHQNEVFTVAWSPDSTRIASAGGNACIGAAPGTCQRTGDRTVQVWEAKTGKLIYKYPGHSGVIRSVAWSPVDQSIASGSEDTTVQVWEARTGKRICKYTQHQKPIIAAGWSPSGKYIASRGFDDAVRVWQPPQGIE